MSKGFASNYRIWLLALVLLLCFGGISARLVWLHAINRDEFLGNIAKTRRQIIVEEARRGDILDSRGALLATSSPVLVLGVDPQSVRKEDEAKWPQLSALIGLPEAEIRRIFTTKFRSTAPAARPAMVAATPPREGPQGLVFNFSTNPAIASAVVANASGITPAAAAAVEETAAVTVDFDLAPAEPVFRLDSPADDTEIDAEADASGRRKIQWAKLVEEVSQSNYDEVLKLGIKGVYANKTYRRTYPHSQLGAHLIGYVDRAQKPVAGVERYADFYLRGQEGWREGERDGKGRELPQFSTRRVPHADGYSVRLSVEMKVQNLVERELAQIAATYQPLKATIVVSDPRTGFILGLGNYPTFNPNEYNKVPRDRLDHLKNIAVGDIYEPGSVFKIVAAAGALERGLVSPQTTFDCSVNKIDYLGQTRKLPGEDHHFDHPLSVAEIVSRSSNRGAAQLAMKLGGQQFYDFARAFGFGQRTGLTGLHEEIGIMHRPETWNGQTITRMPMGQSVAVTVMQMHQAMGVIASGGVLLRPQMISEIRDAAGDIVCSYGRAEVGRAISERTARTMAQLLAAVVTKEGTAIEASIPGYEVAGKTGTTQKYIPMLQASGAPALKANGHPHLVPSRKNHVASFVGFFPASNPQVVISVIVDDADARCPNGIAYGGKVAAPVFKRLGEALIPILEIKAPGAVPVPVLPKLVASQTSRR